MGECGTGSGARGPVGGAKLVSCSNRSSKGFSTRIVMRLDPSKASKPQIRACSGRKAW